MIKEDKICNKCAAYGLMEWDNKKIVESCEVLQSPATTTNKCDYFIDKEKTGR